MLTIDVERRLACNRDFELRTGREQLSNNRGSGDKMLEVIEQQKHRLVEAAHVLFHAFLRRLIRGFANSQGLRDRGSNQSRIAHPRQWDKAKPPRELVGRIDSYVQ